MRNTLKITVITLALLTLTACSKESKDKNKDDGDPYKPKVTTSSLSGTWKITKAMPSNLILKIDFNGDGIKNHDLLKEGFKACEYSSPIIITETTFTIKKGGKNCTADDKDEVYDYKYYEKKPYGYPIGYIDLYQNGKIVKSYENFYLEKTEQGLLVLNYEIYNDSELEKITNDISTPDANRIRFELTKM